MEPITYPGYGVTEPSITYPGYGVTEPSLDIQELSFQAGPIGPDEIATEVTHCGVCHSDIHHLNADWEGMIAKLAPYPLCCGHEVIAKVVEVGSNVTTHKVGDRVGFGPQRDSCGTCEMCEEGRDNLCLNYKSLYNPSTGGFGSHIRAPASYAFHIPSSIPSHLAAPLLCAGSTVYSPLKKANLAPGSRVAVMGIGGLGHLCVQMAVAMGYEVTAITRSLDKVADIKGYGATHVIDSNDKDEMARHTGRFHMVINTSSAHIDLAQYLALVRRTGTFVFLGLGAKLELNPFNVVIGEKTITGSFIGGKQDIIDMFELCSKHNIYPTVEVVEAPFGHNNASKVSEAIQKIINNQARYRMVLDYQK